MPHISEANILIMATDGFEQSELLTPLQRLKEFGASVQVTAPHGPTIKGWNEKDWGENISVDLPLGSVKANAFHALVLPGGVMNPDQLRRDEAAIDLIAGFLNQGKIIAAICHAPWLLIEAGAVEGRQLTSFPSIRTDVENAGGQWLDQEVVVDDSIITSRSPKDLDAFVAKIVEAVETSENLDGALLRDSA